MAESYLLLHLTLFYGIGYLLSWSKHSGYQYKSIIEVNFFRSIIVNKPIIITS